MRTPLPALATAVATIACLPLLTPSAAAAATPRPDLPEVRTSVDLRVTGEWAGRLAFGTHVCGSARAQRSLPLEMLLSRTDCDMTGCMTTEIVVGPEAGVASVTRVAAGLTSAALDRATIGVTVRRIMNGAVVAEHPATLTLEVRAQRSGAVIKRTTLTQGPDGEVLTVSRSATVRASVTLGSEVLSGTGEVVRSQIVD